MKKPIVTFTVALLLSVIATFISPLFRLYDNSANIANYILDNTMISIVRILITLSLFFGVFYFLASKRKIRAVKFTAISIIAGVLLGSAIVYMSNILLYGQFITYLALTVGAFITAIIEYFFPSIIALMFVELKDKRANDKLNILQASPVP